MFGIGGTELLVILVVALIVLGPKSVPQIARTLGKAMGEFRKVSTEFQRTLNTEIELEEHEKRKQEAEKELFGTEQKATAATKPAEAASPAAKPASRSDGSRPDGNRRFRKGLGMTEREDKTPVAPSGAAEEQEILLDSPIVESEDEPGAVDAPGVSGSKEPDEAAVESTPVVEEDAVEPVPPVEEAIAGNPEAAASADADASAGLPEIPEGASSAWPQEETLPAPAAGGEPPAPVDPPSGEEEEPEEERPMTLLEHLGELRKRLVRGFLAILIGFFACYGFAQQLFYYLSLPLLKVMPADSKFIYTGVAEGFFVDMKVAFVAGVFVACPFLFYQIWAFIAPGLYEEEKKYIIPLALSSALFFILGGVFCYFGVFPFAFEFFMSYSTDNIVAMLSIDEYLSFALKMVLAFGLIFEMPLSASSWRVWASSPRRRCARCANTPSWPFLVVAAILTPPDVFSQLMMAGPHDCAV